HPKTTYNALRIFILCLQSFFLFFTLYNMANRNSRMMKNHSRTGKSHNLFNSFSHFSLVAMYLAVRTEGFCFHKRASVASHNGIIQKLLTLRTKTLFSFMLFSAIKGN